MSIWDGSELRDSEKRLAAPGLRFRWHLTEAEAALKAGQNLAAAFHLERLRKQSPPDVLSSLRRGHLLARFGALDEAARDQVVLLDGGESENPSAWHDSACILLLRHDVAGYRRLCTRLGKHYPAGDFSQSSMVFLITVLGPGGADAKALTQLGERVGAQDPANPALHWGLGLAHYRAGEWHKAISRLQAFIRLSPDSDWLAWPVLALAEHGLGNKDRARHWLQKAAERHRTILAQLKEPLAGFALEQNWPEFEVVYAEADATIIDR